MLKVADDLGYSDIGCCGGEIHTPNLDCQVDFTDVLPTLAEAAGAALPEDFQVDGLNGEPLHRPWFSRASLVWGGHLRLALGNQPETSWGAAPEDAPPSLSD